MNSAVRKNLEEVLIRGKELYERLGVLATHIKSMGNSLETTLVRYNEVVGSWDRRIAPTLTRFQELDVRVGAEIDDVKPRFLQRERDSNSGHTSKSLPS